MRKTANVVSIGCACLAILGTIAIGACIDLRYSADPANGHGLRCWPGDEPRCPDGFQCCAMGRCDDVLRDTRRGIEMEGWCVPAGSVLQTQLDPKLLWDFGDKLKVAMAQLPSMLDKVDPHTGRWGCPRSLEPNDLPDDATRLGTLVPDNVSPDFITAEICPAQNLVAVADIDVFRFAIAQPGEVRIELQYDISQGDLDVALFAVEMSADAPSPLLIQSDLDIQSNGIIDIKGLTAGSYYVVIRGAPLQVGHYNGSSLFNMNTYGLRVSLVTLP